MSQSDPKSIWNDPRITAYALGELSGDERAAFEAEIADSADLAAAVEEAKSVTGQLASLYAAEQTPPLDEERRQAILAADDSVKVSRPPSQNWCQKNIVACVVAATCACIVVGLSIPAIKSDAEVAPYDFL